MTDDSITIEVTGEVVDGRLHGRPVKLTDGTWAVMVQGNPAMNQTVIVTTLEGKRWAATITEVHSVDETTGEVLCLTARGPALPDATAEELADRQRRSQVWIEAHKQANAGKGCAHAAALAVLILVCIVFVFIVALV